MTPGLAVVLVGDRKDSSTYVRMKKRACAKVGVKSFGFDYPSTVTQEELLNKIDELNNGTAFVIDYPFKICIFMELLTSLLCCVVIIRSRSSWYFGATSTSSSYR